MKRTSPKRGFTLIEMLVVCLIVVLLAGLVFRMVGVIGRHNDTADTVAKIEMVANALEEFKSIYGKYPPVRLYRTDRGMEPLMRYEFPQWDTYGETLAMQREAARRMIGEGRGRVRQWDDSGTGGVFSFGLCSFFVPRVNGTAENGGRAFLEKGTIPEQWSAYNTGNESGDSQRDLDAVRRILPHLGGRLGDNDRVVWEHNKWGNRNAGILNMPWDGWKRPPSGAVFTNDVVTVRDSWGHDLNYYSIPPYESYKLWSSGPDGLTVGDKCRSSGHAQVHRGEHGSDWGGAYWRIMDGDPETEDDIIGGRGERK